MIRFSGTAAFVVIAARLTTERKLYAESREDKSFARKPTLPGLSLWGSNAFGIVNPTQPQARVFRDPQSAKAFFPANDQPQHFRSVSLGRAHAGELFICPIRISNSC